MISHSRTCFKMFAFLLPETSITIFFALIPVASPIVTAYGGVSSQVSPLFTSFVSDGSSTSRVTETGWASGGELNPNV